MADQYVELKDLLRVQEGKRVKDAMRDVHDRQERLLERNIDIAIRIVAEDCHLDWEELQRRRLIRTRPDVDGRQIFTETLKEFDEDYSATIGRQIIAELAKKGLLISHADLATDEEMRRHVDERKRFKRVERERDKIVSGTADLSALTGNLKDLLANSRAESRESISGMEEYDDPLALLTMKAPVHPKVERLNALADGLVEIVNSDIKSPRRIREKVASRYNPADPDDISKITDITRVSVIPKTMEIAQRIGDLTAHDGPYSSDGTVLSNGGLLQWQIKSEIGGFIAETRIINREMAIADKVSHQIFETIRLMEDEHGRRTGSDVAPAEMQKIADGYQTIVRNLRSRHPILQRLIGDDNLKRMESYGVDDFQPQSQLMSRHGELKQLNMALHISAAIKQAQDPQQVEWARQYYEFASMRNSMDKLRGTPTFPPELLKELRISCNRDAPMTRRLSGFDRGL